MFFDKSSWLFLGKGKGEYLGCYKDDPTDRDLGDAKHKSTLNSPEYCINMCLASGV